MQLRTELALVVFGFVALNLLLVFTAIGLFARMGPAIERIMLRNEATIEAAEDILEVLALGPTDAAEDHERTMQALERAWRNVTEAGEEPLLAAIAERLPSALAGDAEARTALVGTLGEVIELNRAAMRAVDQEAQRMGRGGAWAAAFVGLASVGLSLFLTRSLGVRVVLPIRELRDTLLAVHSGDRFRRCSARQPAPELGQALAEVNRLLDSRVAAHGDDDDE